VSFDASRLNFRGLGHTVSFRSRLSNIEKRGLLSYTAPRVRDIPNLTLIFTALYSDSDYATFRAKREEGSVQLSQKLSKANTILYRFTYRRNSVGSIQISPLLIPLYTQPVRIGLAAVNFVQDKRDDPIESHKGVFNTVDVGLASNIFGSQSSFTRFLGRNTTYHQIGKKLVLARSLNVGWLLPITQGLTVDQPSQADIFSGVALEEIPLAERLFSGGGSSHRGFPENQAGPRDIGVPQGPGGIPSEPTGFPLGGNAVLFNKVELRFPLIGDNIGGVIFHDAGNVFRTPGSISFRVKQRDPSDFGYMVHAAGFGVRYRTPLGPVRADLAYSINPPSYNGFKGTVQELLACGPPGSSTACQSQLNQISHFQFFFSIGQTF
jgi:outer membrane protein assembly factor BamA